MRRRPQRRGEPTLLERSRTDPAAFEALYARYFERVLIFLTRRALDADVALDLAADTFAEVLEKRSRFRGHTDAEQEAWIFAIAWTKLRRFWRDGATERRALQRLGIETPAMTSQEIERIEELAGIAGRARQLAAAMTALPADQREAIELRVVHELDYAAVAERVGASRDVVRARVSRGLRRLADAIDHDPVESER